MLKLFKRLVVEEEAQGLVEYALIIALIAILVIGAVAALGTKVNDIFTEIETELTY